MARPRTVAGAVTVAALKKFPKASTKTIARSLYAKQPELWANLEACRTSVRYYRGAAGKQNRQNVTEVVSERTPEESEACREWGMLLPHAEPTKFEWEVLEDGPERWLILADVHLPYHHEENLIAALTHAENNCDAVLLLGDCADAYQMSHWERDPTRRRFREEVEAVKLFLDAIVERLKPKQFVYKAGNHESRYERYLMQKAPELFDMPGFQWRSFLELDEKGIRWVPAHNPLTHHALTLIHGHEWGNRFSSPVNPARGAFLKAHECVIEGHGHRTSHHTEHTLRGRPISCWSVGCLCDLNPLYRPLGNKWNPGFAYLNAGKNWSIENYRIIDGVVK